MCVVKVTNLIKRYEKFILDDVSFELEKGHITGFIGRNGAGKTTTIKCMLNLIHFDSGEINFFNKNLLTNEIGIKKEIGYSSGNISWYPRKKIKDIVGVIKRFYPSWDDLKYQKYLEMFEIDENKTPIQLSEGMKVKCNLLLALSHNAKLLILDEPTSGLDPFSRDELLNLFIKLKNEGITIFFSTHIVSDLEKCADDILYISKGKIFDHKSKADFIKTYSRLNESLEETILRLERGKNDE